MELIVPADRLRVLPPLSADEPGFDDAHDLPAIFALMQRIAREKCDDVRAQLQAESNPGHAVIVTADTTIIAEDSHGRPIVLGQPPDDDTYAETVRGWFRDCFAGKTHIAATALCVAALNGRIIERIVESQVTFRGDVDRWLEWYLATGEPRGKAGGYAIQGAGSLFVERVEGSLSNVIGLPLEALMEVFGEFGRASIVVAE